MSSIVIWVASIALAAAAMVLTAASENRALHLAIASMVAIVIIALAVRDHRAACERGESCSQVYAGIARTMSVLWAWSAVCLFLTYALIKVWSAWGAVFAVSAVIAGLCMFAAHALERDGEERLAGAAAFVNYAMFGLSTMALGAIPVLIGYAGLAGGADDWAAINIIITTIGGIAFVSGLPIAVTPAHRTA